MPGLLGMAVALLARHTQRVDSLTPQLIAVVTVVQEVAGTQAPAEGPHWSGASPFAN